MGARWKRWMTAIAAIVAADAAILLAAGVVLTLSQQMHASAMALVGAMLADLGALVPARLSDGLTTILGVFGAGWFQQILGPSFSGASGSGVPALGGVLAAPVYTFVRRRVRRPARTTEDRVGAPPHRVFVATAKALEPDLRISTAVQEST